MCKKYLFSIIEIEKRTFFRMCIKNLHLLLGFDDPWGVLSFASDTPGIGNRTFFFVYMRSMRVEKTAADPKAA
jgi:hypothetical protein